MLKKLLYLTVVTTVTLLPATPSLAAEALPGKGITLQPARATWNTGFFHEAIVRRGLEELGYTVKKPKNLANPIFYKAVTLGDVDYWVNGWFPMHNAQLPQNFDDKAVRIGYAVKAGGLQGYLVSKKEAEKFGITSLDDFKREEVKKAFDRNGDGRADLTSCPPGWGCHDIITHHLDVYKLNEHIKPGKASYEAGMAATLAAHQNGEPIFFYTWAPNWTIFKLKPGRDVVWINVPEINPTEAQKAAEDRMTATGVDGAVSDPIKLGFVVTDIRIVANKKFAEKNPAAARFFELFTIDLQDINEQNNRMNAGEKSEKDIARHADEWIAKNRTTWDGWLEEAKKAAQ